MKIRGLELKNIGVFENTMINFPEKKNKGAEIHILTGENGTGKTTILQALASGVIRTKPFEDFLLVLIETLSEKNFRKRFSHNKCEGKHGKIIFDDNNEILFGGIQNVEVYDVSEEFREEKRKTKFNKFSQENIFNFSTFAYSGYRFIEDQENISIKEKEHYNPLENALEFNKTKNVNDYTLNEWLANKMAQRNSAFFEGNNADVEKYSRGIENLKQIIEDIIEIPIDFKFKNEKLKVVAVKVGQELDFDLLPDGLRSIISWLGDLLMRMDALKWENDTPVFEREFVLFLDEIEVHLHPAWQRKILPIVQKLFVNAQIFITTHSPFIVNSVDGAYIYELKLDANGNSVVAETSESNTAQPIDEVLGEIYDIEATQMYGVEIEREIENFQGEVKKAYQKTDFDKVKFLKEAKHLATKSEDLKNKVQFELRQLSKSLAEDFKI